MWRKEQKILDRTCGTIVYKVYNVHATSLSRKRTAKERVQYLILADRLNPLFSLINLVNIAGHLILKNLNMPYLTPSIIASEVQAW